MSWIRGISWREFGILDRTVSSFVLFLGALSRGLGVQPCFWSRLLMFNDAEGVSSLLPTALAFALPIR